MRSKKIRASVKEQILKDLEGKTEPQRLFWLTGGNRNHARVVRDALTGLLEEGKIKEETKPHMGYLLTGGEQK
jgi:hypothetical protein